MITAAIINVILGIFNFILSYLPIGHINTSVVTAVTWFMTNVHGLDGILPVAAIMQTFVWTIYFEVAFFTYNLFWFIYDKVRGI
jgi:hypothetical protein